MRLAGIAWLAMMDLDPMAWRCCAGGSALTTTRDPWDPAHSLLGINVIGRVLTGCITAESPVIGRACQPAHGWVMSMSELT